MKSNTARHYAFDISNHHLSMGGFKADGLFPV